jgi:hypothetical protein
VRVSETRAVTRTAGLVLPCAAGAACFLYRYLTYDGFTNDHFVNLSRAQQILFGEMPVRDFVDPGLALMYYVSAAFQIVFGRTLLSEALLVFGALALAAAVTCWVALRLTGSPAIAAVVTVCQIVVFPRSYGYPKMLLYALALLGVSLYAQAPQGSPAARVRVLLGCLTAVAFLMRHDHGVFIGIACAAAIVLVEFHRGVPAVVRALAAYAAVAIVLVVPYLVLIESSGGLVQYVRDGLAFSRAEAARSSLDRLPGFSAGTSATVAANAQAWLFYLPWAMSAVVLARLAMTRDVRAAAVMVPALLLSMLVAATFLRSPLSERLADVWGPLPIVLAVALAPIDGGRRSRGARRWSAALVLVLTVWSVGVVGRVPAAVATAGLWTGGISERFQRVTRDLSTPAAAARAAELARPLDERTILTYLFACTNPSDRMLAFLFAPEIFYLTERGFAAGHVAFVVGYHGREEEQRLAVERWQSQSVPFSLMLDDKARDAERFFPLVARELHRRYEAVARTGFDMQGSGPLVVMAERGRVATSTYEPLGLPCFAERKAPL